MIELITLLIILFIVLFIKIRRKIKLLSTKEQEFMEEQRMFCNTKVCRIYDVLKIALTVIAFLATVYTITCLDTGRVIGIQQLTSAKFWEIAGGSVTILLPRFFLRKAVLFCKTFLLKK